MSTKLEKLLVGIASMLAAPYVAASPILLLEGTTLIGARGVEVAGSLYDVSFRDGGPSDLYPNGFENIPFQNDVNGADAASRALESQVFVGLYDSNPFLTRGCAGPQGFAFYCNVFTVYKFEFGHVEASGFLNDRFEINDSLSYIYTNWLDPGITIWTQAIWSSSVVAQVPEPSSIGLFGIGLGGLAVARRKYRIAHKRSNHPVCEEISCQ